MGVERISTTLHSNKAKRRKSLIVFLTAGDPSLEATKKAVVRLAAIGVDLIELGVPFSDPVADGPVIQAASQRALAQGTSLKKIISLVDQLRREVTIPLVLMSYYNPLLQYGLERLASDLATAGCDGLIVPDLPLEEGSLLRKNLQEVKLAYIPLVAPNTPSERLRRITATASGFVYCVSLAGVTGARATLPAGIKEYLERVRKTTDLPLGLGFGISSPEQAELLAPYCDALIIGSKIVQSLHENGLEAGIQLVRDLHRVI